MKPESIRAAMQEVDILSMLDWQDKEEKRGRHIYCLLGDLSPAALTRSFNPSLRERGAHVSAPLNSASCWSFYERREKWNMKVLRLLKVMRCGLSAQKFFPFLY